MDSSDNGVYGVNNYTENLINKGFSIKRKISFILLYDSFCGVDLVSIYYL